jgi:hypothetical protein
LARTSFEMDGFDPKTALAIAMTPGFWLLKAEIERHFHYPHFAGSERVPLERQTHHPSEGPLK